MCCRQVIGHADAEGRFAKLNGHRVPRGRLVSKWVPVLCPIWACCLLRSRCQSSGHSFRCQSWTGLTAVGKRRTRRLRRAPRHCAFRPWPGSRPAAWCLHRSRSEWHQAVCWIGQRLCEQLWAASPPLRIWKFYKWGLAGRIKRKIIKNQGYWKIPLLCLPERNWSAPPGSTTTVAKLSENLSIIFGWYDRGELLIYGKRYILWLTFRWRVFWIFIYLSIYYRCLSMCSDCNIPL